ncbi:MAG TPA: GDP-mannose 4,6-dehydratase [Chloroflexia bacterium]|nr:GDP-mannose 4,6-dehydratase [Chloroflexia bacterium]
MTDTTTSHASRITHHAPNPPSAEGATRALVTGAGGFVGKHLLTYLLAHTDWHIYGNAHAASLHPGDERVSWVASDLTDRKAVASMVAEVRPNFVFHLAAQSNVQQAFKDPERTFMTNVIGQLNLLDVLRESVPGARVLVVCSSEEYGLVRPEDIPIDEDTPFRPNNPYAVSKIAQDALATQYFLSYGQPTIRVRPFNHIGPGQTEHFVTAAFAHQVARIEAGLQEPVISVGNLEAERDFTDVRDTVGAYHLALTQGEPGEVYNIGSGVARKMQWILDTLVTMSKIAVEVRQDPSRMRPSDIPQLVCNPTKFNELTGWQPQIPIEQTLKDILDYWRERVKRET